MAPTDEMGIRSSLQVPAVTVDGRHFGCARCMDPPCRTIVDAAGAHKPLCPTDAIGTVTEAGITIDAGVCIGCGVCVLRCPTGAIYFTGELPAPVAAEPPGPSLHPSDEAEHRRAIAAIDMDMTNLAANMDQIVSPLVASASDLTQKPFYRLVADLFELAGFRADLGHGGDTSSRFDLLLPDTEDSIPVEIKSRTETEAINVKSIQQAVENKVIVDRRGYPSKADSSTLVVGWEYPPPRSDVTELIDDIYMAFRVSVGMISLRVLYKLALQSALAGTAHDRSVLNTLRGRL